MDVSCRDTHEPDTERLEDLLALIVASGNLGIVVDGTVYLDGEV